MADQNAETFPFARLQFAEGSAPATPSAGVVETYAKADGKLYSKDDAGVERLMSGVAAGTPALTLSTTNSAGSASTALATDATIAAFDATAPSTQAFGDAAAAGSAGKAARRDHKHAMPGAPGLLAYTQYAPGSETTVASTTSASSADVDAVNLAVTFVAPASGSVLVRFTAAMSGPASDSAYWQIREGSSVLAWARMIDSNATNRAELTHSWVIGGLSAGSHTIKFGFSTGAATASIYAGPLGGTNHGPVLMEVWAAPY